LEKDWEKLCANKSRFERQYLHANCKRIDVNFSALTAIQADFNGARRNRLHSRDIRRQGCFALVASECVQTLANTSERSCDRTAAIVADEWRDRSCGERQQGLAVVARVGRWTCAKDKRIYADLQAGASVEALVAGTS